MKLLIATLTFLNIGSIAQAEVRGSKANTYSVVSPPTGVSSSKSNVYSVIGLPSGANVRKANTYVVTAPPLGAAVRKAQVYVAMTIPSGAATRKSLVYVVLAPPLTIKQPNIYIFSKNDRTCFEGRSASFASTECKKPYSILENLYGSL